MNTFHLPETVKLKKEIGFMDISHPLRKAPLRIFIMLAVAVITLVTTGYSQSGTAFRISNNPKVTNLTSNGTPTQHTFGRNTSGDVIHYYWSPIPSWAAENLTTGYSNIGTAYRVATDLAVITGPTADSNALVLHAFGRNSAGDLIHYYWISSLGWAAENLTTGYSNIGTAFRIVNTPVVINLFSNNTPTQHVFGRNSIGDVIHYYWSPSAGWAAENLTAGYSNIGIAYRVVSDLAVINGPTSDSNAPVQHVFARNSAGDLIHYYWISSQGWAAENLTN